MDLREESARYSFADVLNWPEKERIELIYGAPVLMAPPSFEHQRIAMEVSGQIYQYLRDKSCLVLQAPFGVRLFEKEGDEPEKVDTCVEPDVTVICDRGRIDKNGYKGPPAWIVEILSPSDQAHDRSVKYKLYEKAGVGEFWLLDPESRVVQVFVLRDGRYQARDYHIGGGLLASSTFEDLKIDLDRVFPE